ncbi:unnamed protein product [Diamesa serratosioi]
MHNNNFYPVNSNDNGAYSVAYSELVSNNHVVENDFANIFLLNEQTNQLQSQLFVNSHNDQIQNNYSAQIEAHIPEYQYNINNTDYVLNHYQHNQNAEVMDTMVSQEDDMNNETIYKSYSHDNVDMPTVSIPEVANTIEIINNVKELGISPYRRRKNQSDLGTVKKKGRPKGSINQHKITDKLKPKIPEVVKSPRTPRTPKPPKQPKQKPSIVKTENIEPSRLPRMGLQLAHFKLSPEKIEEYKKSQQPFLQPGVCFRIAPKLDSCVECTKLSLNIRRKLIDGECRFYHFRKLKYNEELELQVYGFLDPIIDPFEIDRHIWTPSIRSRNIHTMTLSQALLIIYHISDEFCELVKQENDFYNKWKNPEKPIIWKRLINGVLEICDNCSTTLFNYHFMCTTCGLSLCMDCINDDDVIKDEKFHIDCTSNKQSFHTFNDLSLTQIITGDSLQMMHSKFHQFCKAWSIDHQCEHMDLNIESLDQTTKNFIKNIMIDAQTGKSMMTRELPTLTNPLEISTEYLKNLKLDGISNDSSDKIYDGLSRACDENGKMLKSKHHRLDREKPRKIYSTHGKENILAIMRILSSSVSELMYDVPHNWLCENRLLHLKDPSHPGNDVIFHDQWQRGQPVLISNVLENLQRELWVPQAFSHEFGNEKSDLINCMTGNLVRDMPMSVFWDGFEEVDMRLKDSEKKPMLLKLKDWPPDMDFKKIMPTRFEDIMKNLPLNAYTNRNGDLNLVKYLPNCFLRPDLGPKGYFAYGSPFHLKEGTTNLHLDVSDAVNVMIYIGFPRDPSRGASSVDDYVKQGFQAIIEADCDISNINRVRLNGDIPGALWHIFAATDADKIRDFLISIANERGFQVDNDHDVIHDQNWYLDGELRKRLYTEYGVKGYAIVQCLGDCIILPAGTPHQVRNIYSCIKIAEDFVSPENISHIVHLSNEFRRLTKTHTNNEDKLQIKNIIYHSIKESLTNLENIVNKKRAYKEVSSKLDTSIQKEENDTMKIEKNETDSSDK